MAGETHTEMFKTLGLSPGASIDEIKKAFRKLAKKVHPDKSNDSDADEKFKLLNAAYVELLSLARKDSCEQKKYAGNTDLADDLSDKLMNLKVTEHSQCVVVDIGLAIIQQFYEICVQFYGEPVDKGKHGQKFSRRYCSVGESADATMDLGVIHITIYLTTGRILVQGKCYLLWHAEHLPHLISLLPKEAIQGTSNMKSKEQDDSKAIVHMQRPDSETDSECDNSCCVCDLNNTDHMIRCDACEQWLHYACSKIYPEAVLRQLTDNQDSTYICWQCAVSHKGDRSYDAELTGNTQQGRKLEWTPDHTIIETMQSVERSIVECIRNALQSNDQQQEKHALEMNLMKQQHLNEKSTLQAKIRDLQEKVRQGAQERTEPDDRAKTCVTHEALITELRAKNLQHEETATQYRDQIGILKTLNSQLECQLKEKSQQLKCVEERIEINESKITTLEQTNESMAAQNKKLNEDLWALLRSKAEKSTNSSSAESPANERVHNNANINTHVPQSEPEPEPASTNNNENGPTNNMTVNEVTRLRQDNQDVPENDRTTKHVPQKTRKGGHIIITSSIGKDIDPRKVAPQANQRVYLKPIRGACIKDVHTFVEKSPYQHASVSVLVGGNDISNGSSVDQCIADYISLIDTIRANNPGAVINLLEVPPRIKNRDVSNNIYDFNQAINDLTKASEYDDCVFHKNGLNESAQLYQPDGIHLSTAKGGGVPQLAMAIRKAVLSGEGKDNGAPANHPPVANHPHPYKQHEAWRHRTGEAQRTIPNRRGNWRFDPSGRRLWPDTLRDSRPREMGMIITELMEQLISRWG